MMGFFSRLLDGEERQGDELGSDMRAALATLVQRVLKDKSNGFTLTIRDCTVRDVPVGDWRFIVERIPGDEK